MNYLVKSIKWTKNDGVETWWGPDENGYTTRIYEAGIYNEEQAQSVLNRAGEKVVKLFPIDQKIINKCLKQIHAIAIGIEKDRDRSLSYAEECDKRLENMKKIYDEWPSKVAE